MESRFVPPQCSFCCDDTRPTDPTDAPELGSPRRQCPRCGKTYFDNQYAESALYLYNTKPVKPKFLLWLFASVYFAVILFVYFAVMHGHRENWLSALTLVAALIICLVRLYRALHARRHWDEFKEKFRQKNIMCLQGIKKSPIPISQSLDRLSREDYLYYLLSHGTDVPDYFFHRIDCQPDPHRLEEAARQHEATQKYLKTLQTYYDLKAEAERFEHFLSLDSDDIAFRKQAELHNMTPPAFESYCKEQHQDIQHKLNTL